jgi:ABC-type nitrate/sulfonate/bicarbonate transport system substrate-binding protein
MKLSIALLSLLLTATVQAQESLTVVLDWTVNTNHTGLYVAQSQGYFKDEALEVAIEMPPETGAASLLVSGTAQVGVSYQEEITMARASGIALTAIAAVLQHNTSGFASRASAGITRPRDFAGKRYGGWGSPIEEAMVKALTEQDGGDQDSIEILPIGSMDFFAATASAVDFVWIFEGWDGVAATLKDIDINFIPLATIPALDYYTPVLAANADWLAEHPETAKAFLRAVTRGYRYAIENPAAAAQILLDVAPELDPELVRKSQEYLAGQYQADAPQWGVMELSRWQDYADWLQERGLLEGSFTAHEAFSNDYLP